MLKYKSYRLDRGEKMMEWIKKFLGDLYKVFAVVIILLIMFYFFLPDNPFVNNLLSLAVIIALPLSFADLCSTAYDLSEKLNKSKYMKFFFILSWGVTIIAFGMFFWLIYKLTIYGWFTTFYKDYAFMLTGFGGLSTALFLYTLACKRELELITEKGKGRLIDVSSIIVVMIIIFAIVFIVKNNQV